MRINACASLLRSAAILVSVLVVSVSAAHESDEAISATDELMSYDGLYPVPNSRADAAWARPDMDIGAYDKIMLQGVGIQYRPGGAKRSSRTSVGSEYYEVTPAQKERFQKVFAEKFREELAKTTRFTIVSEPGPDVLLIKGGLIDVVSYVPPDAAEVRRLAGIWPRILREQLDHYASS